MKPFGQGSSLFHLKNKINQWVEVTITLDSEEKYKDKFVLKLYPDKEKAEKITLEGKERNIEIPISEQWEEKSEDLCANTFITLNRIQKGESNIKQILIKL